MTSPELTDHSQQQLYSLRIRRRSLLANSFGARQVGTSGIALNCTREIYHARCTVYGNWYAKPFWPQCIHGHGIALKCPTLCRRAKRDVAVIYILFQVRYVISLQRRPIINYPTVALSGMQALCCARLPGRLNDSEVYNLMTYQSVESD